VERQQESARKLASELVGFPGVKRVMYPGRGSMVAFEVDTADRIKALLERVKIWIFAESLGGTESLITVPAFQTHADVCLEVRDKLGITDRLVRLSLGLEDAQELSLDLKQALENA
jgi:cystathionine gamma-synthase